MAANPVWITVACSGNLPATHGNRQKLMAEDVHQGRANMLNPGDQFPATTLRTAAGEQIRLPDAIDSDYAVVLFYRGHW